MRNPIKTNTREVVRTSEKISVTMLGQADFHVCSSSIKKKPFLPKTNKKKVLKWLVRR